MSEYDGRRVVVGGAGVSGVAAARALLHAGADVTVVDRNDSDVLEQVRSDGARTVVSRGEPPQLGMLRLGEIDDFVVSPGWRPTHPLVVAAQQAGIAVYGEPELAWRLRGSPRKGASDGSAQPIPWLAITGTNGKTTTVTMLASILSAAGLRTIACGNVGYPVMSAVADDEPYDVLAVELSSFQLHWSQQLAPEVGVVLNLADDHLDWHGDFTAYRRAKTAIWRSANGPDAAGIAVGNADDPLVAGDLAEVDGHTVDFTLGEPGVGQVGVVGGVANGALVDAAFPSGGDAHPIGIELTSTELIKPAGAHNVANALAAAAAARAFGVSPADVARGLAAYTPEPHRNQLLSTVDDVRYVNDSKATNPHAAAASLSEYEHIVWLVGGLLKGVDPDALVRSAAPRLRGAVMFGADRAAILAALARHAPTVPVVEVHTSDDGAMTEIVGAATRGCTSWRRSAAGARRGVIRHVYRLCGSGCRVCERSGGPRVNPFAAFSGLLRRPMASYYLLLSSGAMLLIIGLMMVLSASSIDSYVQNGSAFTVFIKQLRWAFVGVFAFWLALVMPFVGIAGWRIRYLVISTALLGRAVAAPRARHRPDGSTSDLFRCSRQRSPNWGWRCGVLTPRSQATRLIRLASTGHAILSRGRHRPDSGRAHRFGHHAVSAVALLGLVWVSGVRFRVLAALGAWRWLAYRPGLHAWVPASPPDKFRRPVC